MAWKKLRILCCEAAWKFFDVLIFFKTADGILVLFKELIGNFGKLKIIMILNKWGTKWCNLQESHLIKVFNMFPIKPKRNSNSKRNSKRNVIVFTLTFLKIWAHPYLRFLFSLWDWFDFNWHLIRCIYPFAYKQTIRTFEKMLNNKLLYKVDLCKLLRYNPGTFCNLWFVFLNIYSSFATYLLSIVLLGYNVWIAET